jgi:hypothetical protein
MMNKKPKTAVERIQEEAERLGVKVEVVPPLRGSGTITFLTKREPEEADSEK